MVKSNKTSRKSVRNPSSGKPPLKQQQGKNITTGKKEKRDFDDLFKIKPKLIKKNF